MVDREMVEIPLWPGVERTDDAEQVLDKLETFVANVQSAREEIVVFTDAPRRDGNPYIVRGYVHDDTRLRINLRRYPRAPRSEELDDELYELEELDQLD